MDELRAPVRRSGAWKNAVAACYRTAPALAGVMLPEESDAELALAGAARLLGNRGVFLAGLIQENEPDGGGSCCPAMFIRDLSGAGRMKISEDRGSAARGCRLDRAALIEAAVRVDLALVRGADVLMVNRFGKAETEGGGLRGSIVRGIELGIPVIVGVRRSYNEAWALFHGGVAEELVPDAKGIARWTLDALGRKQQGSFPALAGGMR
jgi:hypothetical protein